MKIWEGEGCLDGWLTWKVLSLNGYMYERDKASIVMKYVPHQTFILIAHIKYLCYLLDSILGIASCLQLLLPKPHPERLVTLTQSHMLNISCKSATCFCRNINITWIYCKWLLMDAVVYIATMRFSNIYLQRISVNDSISPSQFHTDTAGDLRQHRPHRKEGGVFCSLYISLSTRCCWDPLWLTVSTLHTLCSLSTATLGLPISWYASSS